MIPSFDDGSMFEDDDIVRLFDGLETVRDDDDCTPSEEIMESDIDLLFREAVECAGRFVEDDDFWIFYEDFRDGETLPLTTGEADSFFSDLRPKSIGEFVDELTLRELDRLSKFCFRYF